MDIAKGLEKPCPICDHKDMPHEAQILPSGDILYRYTCSHCGWFHVKRFRGPNVTVEPLIGFKRKPMRWEP